MNNKKVQANMQINVSFLGDTTKLLKQVESDASKLKLDSVLGSQISTSLNKGFRNVWTNLDKMIKGLSTKGLSSKQYTDIFDSINVKLQETSGFTKTLKEDLKKLFESAENQDALRKLDDFKKKLEEISKISAKEKGANTRQQTAIDKLKAETGLDYEVSKKMLNGIVNRRATKMGDTKTQKDWMQANGLDETKLKRALELLKQINAQAEKLDNLGQQSKEISGLTNIESGKAAITKEIGKLNNYVMTEEDYKYNLEMADQLVAAGELLEKEFGEQVPEAFRISRTASEEEAARMAQAGMTIKEIFGQFGIAFSAAAVVRQFQELTKSAFEFYKSLDSALNQIYVVSNLSSTQVDGLKNSFLNMSKQTGMALDDVTRSAVLFYQQGLSTKEVMTMTEVTAQFAKVAGIDATDAADKLTAAVNGYCLAAEDAASVADKFNQVAAVSAADINELSTAFSKAAAQANQAGVSMDNYLAYIATMEEATREAPENIGTSLKTIFSRMQQVKEGGTSEDGETDVNQVETALKSVGIALRDANGELRDLEEVFDELGPKWNTLDRNTQAYLGTIIAGTRQQSRFITLMQNWDRVLELAAESENSAGKQALMHAKAMESIESKVQQLNVAWQEFVSNLTDSSIIKGLIGALTGFLNTINDGVKPITLLGLGISLLKKQLNNIQLPIDKKFKDFFANLKDGFKKSKKEMVDWKTKQNQLKIVNGAIGSKEKNLKDNKDEKKKIESELAVLDIQRQSEELTKKQKQQIDAQIVSRNKQLNTTNKQIEEDEKDLQKLKEQKATIEGQETAREKGVKTLGQAGIALQALGFALSDYDANLSGVMTSLGSGMEAASEALQGNWLSAIVMAGKFGMQLAQTISKWDENIKKKMDDAVSSVRDKLEEYSSIKLQVDAGDDLVRQYTRLSKRIYKTTEDQKKLNDVVQEMADLYDVDVIEDAYGNLSLNINEVTMAIEDQRAELQKLAADLSKLEVEASKGATRGIFNSNTPGKFYEENWKTNRGTYKELINGIEDGLDDDTRKISNSIAQNLSSNLKVAMLNQIGNNLSDYILEGQAQGLLNVQEKFNKLDGSAWNEVYDAVDYLQTNIDNISFQDAQDYLDRFYDNWSGRTEISGEEWKSLVSSINNTVFDTSNITSFFDEIDTSMAKVKGDYYDKKIKNIDDQIAKAKELESYADEGKAIGGGVAATALGTTATIGAINGWNPIGWGLLAVSAVASAGYAIYNAFDEDEYEAKRKDLEKIKKQYEKDKKEFLNEIADNNIFLDNAEDAEQWLTAQDNVAKGLKNLSNETLAYLNGITELSNFDSLMADDASAYAESLNNIFKQVDMADTEGDKYSVLAKYYEENIKNAPTDEISLAVKNQWEEILNQAFNNLSITSSMSFTQLGNELDSISKDLRTMNSLVAEFNEQGGWTLDTFMDLANILDNISIPDLGKMDNGTQYIDNLINALHNLNLAYDANNGYITMNGDALQSLQQIQEAQTKAKIAGVIADLKASKATTETEIAYIDAQIAGAQAVLQSLAALGTGKIDSAKLQTEADSMVNQSMTSSLNSITQNYKNDISNNNNWKTAIIKNIAQASQAWNAYYTAMRNGTADVDALYKAAMDKTSFTWEGFESSSGIDWSKYNGTNNVAGLTSEIEGYIERLKNSRTQYAKTLEVTNAEIGLMQSLYNSDLSKLGSGKEGDTSKIEQYIGKLKEIYNILNRIQILEHRLSTLDSYSEVARGEKYGSLLNERLKYNEELLHQYEFLTDEQKKFTNGYKDFIQSVDGLEGVFEFDKFGQIIVNWEKYNALQDQSIDGEVTLKQKADDVYETYTEMFEDLQGYFDKTIEYYKEVIDLQQEMVDNYISMEDKAAKAIKEIYQKILDTKLDAIDKEKEAIEELRQAREQARKDQENAKAVSGLQTNLQRAMMDTSGASDVSLIKAQQDLDDKLDAIAEDKYSQMLDDIIDQLDEEQETLQDNFDMLFEDMEWLFEWLDNEVMLDDERLMELLQNTDEWATSSELQRRQLMEEWDKSYNTYMAGLQSGKTIFDIWENIGATKDRISTLDKSLTSTMSQEGLQIRQTIQSWQKDVSTTISNAVNSAVNRVTGGGGTTTNSTKVENYNKNDGASTTYMITLDDGYKSCQLKTVKAGDSITLPALSRDGYKFSGWSIPSKGLCSSGTYTYKPTKSETVTAMWTPVNGSVSSAPKLNTYSSPALNYNNKFSYSTGLPSLGYNRYASGGIADYTGPAWIDGTPNKPEAVLNALQTEHFINFTNTLDRLTSSKYNATSGNSSIAVGDITFQVESMSSAEDGEKAFNMFVDKFKEIGNRTGIKVDSFKNTL